MTSLRVARREIRVGRRLPARSLLAHRVAACVRGMAGRRRPLAGRAAPPTMVLPRPPTGITRLVHSGVQLRLALAVNRRAPAVRVASPRSVLPTHERLPMRLPAHAGSVSSRVMISPELLIHRLTSRRERVETITVPDVFSPDHIPRQMTQRRQHPPSPMVLPVAPPLPMAVRRAVAAEAPQDEPPAATVRPDSLSRRAAWPETSHATPQMGPGFDLNGLTDRVIRTIDQRIIAQRERLGRI